MSPQDLQALIHRAHAEGWRSLDLSGMDLSDLPPEIGKLTGLKKLLLGQFNTETGGQSYKNYLTAIPDVVFQLVQLEELDLRDNQITEIRECLEFCVRPSCNPHSYVG